MGATCIAMLISCGPAPEATLEPTPTTTAEPEEAGPVLPMEFPLEQDLIDGGAVEAVRQLLEVADNRPALKLDITSEQLTLTVLDENLSPAAYRWQDDVISSVASDVQYMEQSTFYPAGFPLENIRRLFEVATLLGTGENQMLQIMEYRDHVVHMTVTTRTESQTVFFRQDGTVVPRLGTLSARDIRRGFETLTDGSPRVLALGFRPGQGYWADVQISETVTEHRTRMGGLPVFSSQRSEATELVPFDFEAIEPADIARRQAEFGDGEPCEVTIGNHHDPDETTIDYRCAGERFLTTVDDRELTVPER